MMSDDDRNANAELDHNDPVPVHPESFHDPFVCKPS